MLRQRFLHKQVLFVTLRSRQHAGGEADGSGALRQAGSGLSPLHRQEAVLVPRAGLRRPCRPAQRVLTRPPSVPSEGSQPCLLPLMFSETMGAIAQAEESSLGQFQLRDQSWASSLGSTFLSSLNQEK